MSTTVFPTQSQIQQAIINYIAALCSLQAGVTVISGQGNRVSEPTAPIFVVVTPIRFTRLATNLDNYQNAEYTATINGTTMNVSAVKFGALQGGDPVFGIGLAGPYAPTILQQTIGPPGGPGLYTIDLPQNISTPQMFASGSQTFIQSSEVVVQCDFHSADLTAGDLAQVISTTFRDEFATDYFAKLQYPLSLITPLYADDPRQVPFVNAEEQYEWRWVLEVRMEVDQEVFIPFQYADRIVADATSVQADFH